ncbi:alpha/beta fold hydrolase [Pseudodesulfovibrio sp. F-1]|uniref:Alpha/beta fold hydrolase n=1 Tax=Pseudodesulfovibrio alkaliphilus TaxID=2661613 RepID=A0A7K1KQJ8_9BACT|nr:alpha/beta hydrolase [Pseudodesulfovibrio alkaliphilus]MUM78376.1 alpha/beta fold hydrolase [Pseudodesulfovibrio alkaliphilus]
MDMFEAVETRDENHVAGWVTATDSARLWVEVRGQGRPVIFVHGWTMSSRFWRRQHGLADSYQIVTLDLRGHGRSETPIRGHTIPRYARDLREVIRALDIKGATLVGWSMGGSVALEYWQQFGSDRLSGIALVESSPYPMADASWNTHRFRGLGPEAVQTEMEAMRQDRAAFGSRFVNEMFISGQAPAHALRWMCAEHLLTDDQTAAAVYEDYAARDYVPLLPSLTLPALAVYGRSRHMCFGPSAGRFVAGSIPGAHLAVLERSGHLPFYEEPDTFNAEIRRFLSALT